MASGSDTSTVADLVVLNSALAERKATNKAVIRSTHSLGN